MELIRIVEAILFSTQKPLAVREFREVLKTAAAQEGNEPAAAFKNAREEELAQALDQLERQYREANLAYRLVCVAGAWQLASQPEFAPWIKVLSGEKNRPPRLSQPALETLAIVAYRQPVTRAEIEQIRGVSVDGVMQTLLERGLIEAAGRAEAVGRPITYGTTPLFLEYFGLASLDELPAADELRRIVVERPETLLTTGPAGLATTPPGELKETAAAEPPPSASSE